MSAARNVVVPGRPEYGHFAAYPMVQVSMSRWGHHTLGMWLISVHLAGLGFFEDRVAVVDDFGSLVLVGSAQ